MQKYLESTTVRVEEMRVRKRDAEKWMSHRLLPESLRDRIRKYEQYKWQETRGVDEESLIRNLPKDIKRDIKRHLCLSLLMRVLCAGKDLATDETISRMISLLRQLQQTLPPATLSSTWSSLQPQQQLALQNILRLYLCLDGP